MANMIAFYSTTLQHVKVIANDQ